MHTLKNITIEGSAGKPILLDVFYDDVLKPLPLIIFSHGFKGFKDWGHFSLIGRYFAEAGFVFIKFNFSHNGTTIDDPESFGDLEAFGNNNYTIELNDLKKVIDWAFENPQLHKKMDKERLFLLGHSRGGAISILKAGEDKRVKKLATWAAVSDIVNRNKKRTIETWKTNGVVYAKNARTKQDMPLYYQFYEDQIKNKERLNINHAVKRLEIPFLIVHGTADKAVEYNDAEDLLRSAKNATFLKIENGDHTFGVKHPFVGEGLPPHAREVLEKTIAFFKK